VAAEAEACLMAAANAVLATPVGESRYDGPASTLVVAIVKANSAAPLRPASPGSAIAAPT
jgi:hypothetical protein